MLTKEPDLLRKIAIRVGKLSFLKRLLRPFYNRYHKQLERNRNQMFRKNGLRVIKNFDECLTNNGYKYSLVFGSMLGAIREHGFIKHDLDMDVVMWSEDYSESLLECLNKYGFRRIKTFTVNNGSLGREETYEKDGVGIDIFYIYPAIDTNFPYCCTFLIYKDAVSYEDSMKKYGRILARRIQLPWIKELKRVKFENLLLPVLVNSEDLLERVYGKNYMIPDPKWKPQRNNDYASVWEDKMAVGEFN